MKEIVLTRGLPASGKTTWAKQQVAEHPGEIVRVNRDDLRRMLGRSFDPADFAREEIVTAAERAAVTEALRRDRTVIVDAMHLRPKYIAEWDRFAAAHKADVTLIEFPVEVDEAVRRDAEREESVGEDAIRSIAAKYLSRGDFLPRPTVEAAPSVEPYDPGYDGWPRIALVDIDGTLALNTGRHIHDLSRVGEDALNVEVARLVRSLNSREYLIVYCSGRDEECRDATEAWLKVQPIPHGPLYMRAAGDRRKDWIVKRELLDQITEDMQARVCLAVDDRDQVVRMWRAAGITCLQVADGDF